MKRMVALMALLMSLTASAQRLKVHGESALSDSISIQTEIQVNNEVSKHLTKAGIALQWSSICEVTSWSFAFLSVMSFANVKGEGSGYNKTTGTVCAVIAGVSKILAVSYKHRSGTELQIAAGSISLTF